MTASVIFAGLTRKLDYIKSLGVTAVWLLPFYPSPLKDDGYDIAHYEGVHPAYGTLRDFRAFLGRGARARTCASSPSSSSITRPISIRGSRRRARRSRGSANRDFYVWSDTDERTRAHGSSSSDTERSNWTWDPVARASTTGTASFTINRI